MSKDKKDNLFYVKIFFAIFAAIFLIAIFIKTYQSFTDRQFTQNTFNILIVSEKYIGVLGAEESTKSIFAAVITEDLNSIKKRNLLIQSINFGIPIHAYLVYPEGTTPEIPTKRFFSLDNIQSIITSLRIDSKNITLFDWIKLFNVSRSVGDERVYVKNYASIKDLIGLMPDEDDSYFRDSRIAEKKTSLQIVNGTSINGLGSRLGDMFSRTGFNVVSVVTSKQEESAVYYEDKNVLMEAEIIAKSLDLPLLQSDEHAIAAITLIVGEDSELVLEDLSY